MPRNDDQQQTEQFTLPEDLAEMKAELREAFQYTGPGLDFRNAREARGTRFDEFFDAVEIAIRRDERRVQAKSTTTKSTAPETPAALTDGSATMRFTPRDEAALISEAQEFIALERDAAGDDAYAADLMVRVLAMHMAQQLNPEGDHG